MDPIEEDNTPDLTEFLIRAPQKEGSLPEEVAQPDVVRPSPTIAEVAQPQVSEDNIPDLSQYLVKPKDVTEKPPSLTKQEVEADDVRMDKIRKFMSKTKDVKYESAPAEETMDAFMSHMRWMNTNEVSTAKELINITSEDDAGKAVYGEAYKVYDEMGSMFSNGDAWNGMMSYGAAVVTSPTTWLGLGIGKIAGGIAGRGASKAAQSMAINAAAKTVVKKSGGKIAEATVVNQLRNTSSKAAAKYHIAGVLAAEVPLTTFGDWMYQQTQIEAGVQEEYSYLQGGISAVAGSISAIPTIGILRRSSGSVLADADKLIPEAMKKRAKESSQRAAPQVEKSLKAASKEWEKMIEGGKAFDENIPLQDSIIKWFMDVKDPNSFVRILQKEGADFTFESGHFTRDLINHSLTMGDEAIAKFGKIFEPMGVPSYGHVVEILARSMSKKGEDFGMASHASRLFTDFKNVTISQKNANQILGEAAEEAATTPVKGEKIVEKEFLKWASSTWKKTLVSTPMTTALNVKGWMMARAANQFGDLFIMGGHLGTAGVKALYDPSGSMKHLAKVRSLAENQAFSLQTLVDPFLSYEGFQALLAGAPTKIKKSAQGQIFGGIEDFKPERFGLNASNKGIAAVEGYSNVAQKLSFVHLQDSLTKGVTGMISLDKESRIAFGKGINQLIKDGETWKLTDEMWDRTLRRVLQETYSEDLTKGTHFLRPVAKLVQDFSSNGVGGFVLPFGKFLNFTVANTYRYSPLGFISAAKYIGKEGMNETAQETLARAAVGSAIWAYFYNQEKGKQDEGLQWFEHRKEDGSVENVQNTFPHSMYNLIGRIIVNFEKGEGGNKELLGELAKQAGPLDTLNDSLSFKWLKPMMEMLTDERMETEEDFIGKDILLMIAEMGGGIAAGYTRPFDAMNRVIGTTTPEAGGGTIADMKQARGIDKAILEATRYTSSFFNLVFGEEQEDGTRLMGEPRQTVMETGSFTQPNPMGVMAGSKVERPAKFLNKVLGMVDKPPYKAESFSSGNAEYDAFVNKEITPLLEARAKSLFNNPTFQKMPQSAKITMVDNLITTAQSDLLGMLDANLIGGNKDKLLTARRNLLTSSKPARIRAMKELNITTPEHKLSLYEIDAIRRRMGIETDELKSVR